MQSRRTVLSIIALIACCNLSFSQIVDPIKWETELKKISENEAEIVFNAVIDTGWHLYSTDIPDGGPTPATITFNQTEGVELLGELTAISEVTREYDSMFEMELSYFVDKGTFVQRISIPDTTDFHITGFLEYAACNDQNCLPPTEVPFDYASAQSTTGTAEKTDAIAQEQATPNTEINPLWAPVIEELNSRGNEENPTEQSWWYILIAGFAGGLVALFTPCVWPIIPMTVSFFLKRTQNKRKGIRDAITYGISIIVIYVALGLVITLLFGASALNALSTNAIFNILFFLMLVVFAASFFGAFEITLPSSWSNAVDSKAEKTSGMLSIFLMAFTLTLVSFSCTGPIIGFLLVEVSTTGSIIAPTLGMLGFAVALALPFTLFALFPSWLKSMPRSGGWMNCVKVVLGFLELAFALKFLSVADLAYGWHILDRETFIALWIIIFGLLGLYLLGKIKFPHDDDNTRVSVPRFFLALISLAFAVYMIPGLWGAPLKAVSAFAPPMSTQDFSLYQDEVKAEYEDYDQGMQAALQQGKPVMVDFTGYGCVNCRKMELAVWSDEKVRDIMRDEYILISLYVDDKTPLAVPMKVVENGTERTLNTIGDKWSYLQRSKFGANAQPFYVLLNNEGLPLNGSYSFNEDVDAFVEFLNKGIEAYKK